MNDSLLSDQKTRIRFGETSAEYSKQISERQISDAC
jgi:hypothetical protein